MSKRIFLTFANLCLATYLLAQTPTPATDKDKIKTWEKPYNYEHYNLLMGYVDASGPVYEGNAAAFWGQARTSLLNYMINHQPRHKFQVRDNFDLQLGAGLGGEKFYVNVMMAAGLKFKYDISHNIDFGTVVSYRFGMDRISYIGAMIHGFLRVGPVLLEAGSGKSGEGVATSKERKMTNVNLKYYFSPHKLKGWSLNATYWQIQGRNNQADNPWETCNQYMIGCGAPI